MAVPISKLQRKACTYGDYLTLDDETRYEIIEGELTVVPAPSTEHQDISRNLEFILWGYVKKNGLGVMYHAPVDLVLDEQNVVQPDIVFISNKNRAIIQKQAIKGTPDLLIEILSPSSAKRDRCFKKALYEKFKVEEYWLVDPKHKRIEVFLLQKDQYTPYLSASGKGTIRSNVIQGLEISLSEVF